MVAARIRHIYVCGCSAFIFRKIAPPSLGGSGGDQKDRHANHHADHHEPDIGHGKILIWATVTGSYRQTRSVLRWDRTSQAPSVTRQVWPLVMARPFSLSKIIR